MRMKLKVLGSLMTLLAASAQAPAPPSSAPPVPGASTDNATPSRDQLWDVTTIRCGAWIDASDDDRAAVGMFYYGWLAGHSGIQKLRPVNIQPNLRKVLDVCGRNRNFTIVHAFETALRQADHN
jgi:hypothetical protein